ncbi:hypothetical protein AB5N19_00219 [Seiridium cardinale]
MTSQQENQPKGELKEGELNELGIHHNPRGIGYVTAFPAPGLPRTVRHITGHDADGKAVFLSTDSGDHHLIMGEGQAVANILYSTTETPVDINGDVDVRNAKENEPGVHYQQGTVVRMIDFAPNELSPMHRSVSVDYGVVLEGTFELILESGQKRIMHRGDVSIQRATAHQWRNLSGGGNDAGRMMWVLLGVQDVIVKGKKLEGYMGALQPYYNGKGEDETTAEHK